MATVSAKLFGGISFKVDGKELLKNKKKLPKHVELLAILLAYHDYQLTTANLAAMLWEDEIEDPPAALKNCVYNLRKVLKVKGPDGKDIDFILTEGGRYRWNDAVSIDCDIWNFQSLAAKAHASENAEERISLYRDLIRLYPNEFLGGTSGSLWAIQESETISQQYITVVVELCKLLLAAEDVEVMREVLDLCNRAVFMDPMANEVYLYMYQAMYQLGMNAAIRENYPKHAEFFANDLAMDMYPEITEIYEKACNSHLETADILGNIMDNLSSMNNTVVEPPRGAYVCNYDTFKHMFQLRSRSVDRSGEHLALMLVTLMSSEASEVSYEQLSDNMEQLKNAMKNALRKGDVISRYSGNQLIAMVVIKNEYDTEAVKSRLMKVFESKVPEVSVKLECSCATGSAIS